VWILSPGGVATTEVIKHIARFVSTNDIDDQDGFKHAPKVRRKLRTNQKVLLVTSSESTWVDSLERRGYARHHAGTMGAIGYFFFRSDRRKKSLQAAAERQKRSVERAFGDSLVVDYAILFESRTVLRQFLEISDPLFEREFPARRPRVSDSRL